MNTGGGTPLHLYSRHCQDAILYQLPQHIGVTVVLPTVTATRFHSLATSANAVV